MQNRPDKFRGFRQGLFQALSEAKENVGQIRRDGLKEYRYCKAGATALNTGNLGLAPVINAAHLDEAILAAVVVGSTQLELTVTAGAAIAAGQLTNGHLQINAGTGAGIQYRIDGNSVIDASGTVIYVSLEEPGIQVALDATSKFNLAPNPAYGVVESAVEENTPIGVALIDVAANYFYWAQTKGPGLVLMDGTPAVGTMLVPGAVSGSLKAMPSTLDIDMPYVGTKVHTAGVDTQFGEVMLNIA